jgi:D-alanine-D-alanine ligase
VRIAVLANLKVNAPATDAGTPDAWAELDASSTVEAIVAALERAGHAAEFFEGDLALVDALPRYAPDLCFNLCEGHFGDARESHVPALLEMLRVPYTGAGVLALAVTLDKPTTKRVLLSHGLSTPPFQVFEGPDDAIDAALRYPLFVKPSREGSGIGVTADSVVVDEAQLRRRVARLVEAYRQPALVERFIRGRELTVGLLGNPGAADASPPGAAWARLPRVDGLVVLPAYEILHERFPAPERGFYSHAMKSGWKGAWTEGEAYRCPAPLDAALLDAVQRLAAATFRVTGCRDIARVDIRLDADDGDRPYVLEINALPGVAPGWSDMCFEALAAGLSYDELIASVVGYAARRLGLPLEHG